MTARDRTTALSQEITALSQEVQDLRAFEREYRARLRAFHETQLAELDSPDPLVPLRAAVLRMAEAADGDLKAVLTELPEAKRQRLLEALLRIPAEVTS